MAAIVTWERSLSIDSMQIYSVTFCNREADNALHCIEHGWFLGGGGAGKGAPLLIHFCLPLGLNWPLKSGEDR